ncbi:MAG: SUMF1/EgtB/PvdO family nonheme iron enzyme [Myxococcota bacterium]
MSRSTFLTHLTRLTRLPPRASLSPLLLLVLPSLSCDGPTSHHYDLVDQPQPQPAEVPEPTPPPAPPDRSEPASPDDCGRGTGRNAEGTCESLRTRERDHAQQVQLPAGRFVMGDIPRSYDAAIGRHDPRERWSGQPPRYAEASAFWIDLHEVTRDAYAQCVQAGRCTEVTCPNGVNPVENFSEDAARLVPQTCVTHEQAEAFCRAQGARLPTEAEWEYAARGPDARIYPWGNNMRDEYMNTLIPISGTLGDVSYFGIRGQGTSAVEWVAETYEIDAGLQPFLTGPFRRPDGPLLTAEASRGRRYVIKGGKAGARRDQGQPDPRVGFRCAASLEPSAAPLTVPADPPQIPLLRNSDAGLLVFGGVAEAADRREAEKFCSVLKVEFDDQVYEGWRLPRLDELERVAGSFRGPGPFWSADGAIVQKPSPDAKSRKAAPDDPWVLEPEAADSDAYAARCVRDSTG